MPYRANYPATVREILVDGKKYNPDALRALKAFRRTHPWRMDPDARTAALRVLLLALADAYGIPAPLLVVEDGATDCYSPASRRIYLNRRNGPSVTTFLHEFGHAMGKDERQTCRWSINLFRRVFPRSYRGLVHEGHMLRRRVG